MQALEKREWGIFAQEWNELLSHIPAKLHPTKENYYHSLFILFTRLFAIKFQAERLTSIGQMDLVLEINDKIYIIEFKLNSSAIVALEHIHEKKYYSVFMDKKKSIYLIVFSFRTITKAIHEIVEEKLDGESIKKVYQ